MCIVIDMNTIPCVFNETNEKHSEFKPVKDWIINGKGKMVYGGNTYLNELKKMQKYLKFINILKSARKIIDCSEKMEKIDEKEHYLTQKIDNPDFDDPHIVAILIVSGCQLVCSDDKRAYPYLTKSDWYSSAKVVPKIYSRLKNKNLLHDNNIADVCKPSQRLSKREKDSFGLS